VNLQDHEHRLSKAHVTRAFTQDMYGKMFRLHSDRIGSGQTAQDAGGFHGG
jgi:hypothetical protein